MHVDLFLLAYINVWYSYMYVHIFITKAIKNVNLERKRIHNIILTFFLESIRLGEFFLYGISLSLRHCY